TARGPLLRSGARPGDRILVSGSFGGSILGRHLDVEPRVREALLLHANYELHAGIDCSDGLSLDLSRLAASSNCGAEVDMSKIPIAAAAYELAKQTSDTNALSHALSDGEDFELILAVPPAAAAQIISEQPCAPVHFTDIGQFVAQRGLWQRSESGAVLPLEAKGFVHQ
ncbi:MAG: AIR synthase-related protein, partial [Planctomycetota bacterium]|nr:AIR synthase-related protein [Planctomycetota bacterium]